MAEKCFTPLLRMPSGAVHPNSSNFSRVSRLNVVERVRRLVAMGVYEKRPVWLEFAERAPPMELHNLKLADMRVKSPYPAMVRFVLSQFPDMRFQDCFVEGNDWSVGNDSYRDDHPVMQFVARQLQLMNSKGLSKKEAFAVTRGEYLERRLEIENRQKIEMALACNQRIVPAFTPLFTTGAAIATQREAQLEIAHLNHIRRKLRMLRKEVEPHDKRRMSAKEVALDMEVERHTLLPKIPPSRYVGLTQPEEMPVMGTTVKPDSSVDEYSSPLLNSTHAPDLSLDEFDDEEFSSMDKIFASFSHQDLLPTISDPATIPSDSFLRGHKSRPVEIEEEQIPVENLWKLKEEPVLKVQPLRVTQNPTTAAPTVSRPAWASARPDKVTVQSILARKTKEEIQKRIGKEPGAPEDLDFEDFMTMIKNRK